MSRSWNALSPQEQAAHRRLAIEAFKQCGGNISQAALLLKKHGDVGSRDFVRRCAREAGLLVEQAADGTENGSPLGANFEGLKSQILGFADDVARSQSASVEFAPTVATPEPPPDPIEEERRRIDENRDRRRERDLVKQIASEQSFRAFLEDLMREVAPTIPPPPRYDPPAIATNDTSIEELLMVWSDWHAYETVKAERTLGLNEYNAEVMARRVKQIVTNCISIKERMERGGGWRFPRCKIACNGDFISGTIHEVERHSDAPSVIMAAYGTGLTLAAALRDLSPHFERLDVYCTPGNHGRLPDARRMQQKDPSRNWDTAIYLYAKTALSEVQNIHFHIPDSYVVMYEIGSRNFLQTHGHDIKSWNSIPFYGIDRYGRNVNALLTAKEKPVHFYIISHFHSSGGFPTGGGKSFINGSVIGGTEFSINALGKCDEPTQWMFGVDGKRITHQWEIEGNGDSDETYPAYPWIQEEE